MLHRKRFLSLAAVATLAVAGVACDDGGTETDDTLTEDTTGDTLDDTMTEEEGTEDLGDDTMTEEDDLTEETEGDS